MRRLRLAVSLQDEGDGVPRAIVPCPASLTFPLRRMAGGAVPVPTVRVGEEVASGQRIATSPKADSHASCAGRVTQADAAQVRLECVSGTTWVPGVQPSLGPLAREDFGAFLVAAGIVGMGGGHFPAAMKFASARNIRTLILNGVECEPGTTIDTQLLLHDAERIRAGAEALARASGAVETVLAVGRTAHAERIAGLYPWKTVVLPEGYPGGAERLVLERVLGKRPPAGVLPGELGALVQNVATVRAIGRAAAEGIPCVERPLSVLDLMSGRRRNLIVPVGMAAGSVVEACGWSLPEGTALVAGGLMMGQRVTPETPVSRGTTSLVILPESEAVERACVRCGACFDRCPLGLHPIELAERCRTQPRPFQGTTRTQLMECFLCGVCSAVCPSRIPIAARLREARNG